LFSTQKAKIAMATLLFILYIALGLFIINQVENGKKEYYLEVQSKLLEDKYNVLHKYLKIMSNDIYDMYSNNTKLINLLNAAVNEPKAQKNQTRRDVYNLLIKNYKRLENMGISQVHFHSADNHSFLRMYAPNRYGDDLSKIRKSVVLTNKTKKPQEGMESCPYLLGYRFVYPLFNQKHEHIGSVEISYSTQTIFKNLIEDFIYDHHLLISKKIANNTIVGNQYGYNYTDTWQAKEYYIEESTHKSIKDKNFYKELNTPELKKILYAKIETKKPFAISTNYNYQEIILNFLPIPSVDKIPNIAYIVTYSVSTYLSHIKAQTTYIKLLFFSISFVIYLFILYVIQNREKLKELALYDPLTNLPNKTLLNIELERELGQAKRYNYKVALMFIDLDGFKAINDTYGHHVGDFLLKEVAKKINASIRKVDIASRLSGDEFIIVLSHIKNLPQTITVAENLLQELNNEVIIENNAISIRASIGIAIYPDDADNLQTLLVKADKTMYKAKQNGKNKIFTYKNKEKNNV